MAESLEIAEETGRQGARSAGEAGVGEAWYDGVTVLGKRYRELSPQGFPRARVSERPVWESWGGTWLILPALKTLAYKGGSDGK